VTETARTPRCERVRAQAALAPDGELSVLERRLVEAHLAHCADCRSFATEVRRVVAELRAAAAARPATRAALPHSRSRRTAYGRARAVGAIAAVAAMSFGVATRAPLPSGGTEAQAQAAARVQAGSDLHTIRLLRREALLNPATYPDRAGRSFGDHPA
jgi:predicted anti-sigma-YlaC factor YlaD